MNEIDAHELKERVNRAEWNAEKIADRLSEGAKSFGEMRESLKEVRKDLREAHEKWQEAMKPKPIQTWRIAGFVFTLLVTAGSFVWMFAKYPDREEFNKAKAASLEKIEGIDAKMDEQVKTVTEDIGALRERQQSMLTDQTLIKDSVVRQEKSQDKIDQKIDRLLEQQIAPRVPTLSPTP